MQTVGLLSSLGHVYVNRRPVKNELASYMINRKTRRLTCQRLGLKPTDTNGENGTKQLPSHGEVLLNV